MQRVFQNDLFLPGEFLTTLELVPGKDATGRSVDTVMGIARDSFADGRVSAVSITDNPGGNPFPIEELAFCYDPETPNREENSSGGFGDRAGLGGLSDLSDLLAGEAATATVGLAAAGMLVMRRRR